MPKVTFELEHNLSERLKFQAQRQKMSITALINNYIEMGLYYEEMESKENETLQPKNNEDRPL